MIYDLPKSLDVCGVSYEIRSDFRAVLDICTALSDSTLSGQEKATVALSIMYPDFDEMPVDHYQDALEKCFWFINCGDGETESQKSQPKLMDWEQDFQYIIGPVNRVMGCEVRALDYLHWWSFVAAYNEIGDCLFSSIVRIRDKKIHGKPLDKEEQKWYRKNRELVDFKTVYTEEENELLKMWGGAKNE